MKKGINSSIRSYFLITIQVVLLYVLTGCSDAYDSNPDTDPSPSPGKGSNEVYIQNMAFDPQTLVINLNTTVKWTNKDGIPHTVTSNTGLFDSGSFSNGGTFSFKFTSAGTFNYYCKLHPVMTGKIIVQ